jgi:hypothetical protein
MWKPRLNLGGCARPEPVEGQRRWPAFALSLLVAGCALVTLPGGALAQRRDARSSAEFTARTSVQTIYENLKNAGYDWPYIRDEKMPDILVRSVEAVRKETSTYDRSLILGTWIPTYINTFYDEIDKLNAEHDVHCVDVTFIETTFVPFVQACVKAFDGKFTVHEIAVPILQTKFTYTVCEKDPCARRVAKQYNDAFPRDHEDESDFANLCSVRQ